jgi:hypothetical protein
MSALHLHLPRYLFGSVASPRPDLRWLRCPALGWVSAAIPETFASWLGRGPVCPHRDRIYKCMETAGTFCT